MLVSATDDSSDNPASRGGARAGDVRPKPATRVGVLRCGPALGLVALSALVVAVPTEAQTITVPGALREFTAIAGDGRVRLLITAPRNFREGTYQFRFATGATVPAETAWTVLDRPYFGSVILTGLTNGTAYAFEVRAVNTTGGGPAATAAATPQRAACPAPALGSRRQVLRATLAVGAGPPSADGDVTIFGYAASARDGRAVGALSDTGFQVGATGYSISELSTGNPYSGSVEDGDLVFWFDGRDLSPAHRAALRLHVCDTAYDFSGADYNPDDFTPGSYVYIWQHGPRKVYPVDLDWGLLVDRTVSLSLPPNTPATGTPTVTGTVRVGQVLTAATGTIADADGLTLADAGEAGFGYTYQWVRVDADGMSNPADLPGVTGATYTVTASDVGKRLKVRVSFTDDLNSEEARESDGTVANSVPTASDGRVTARENQDYTFTAADFNYADSDGDPLASVTIKVRPESGALKLDNARVRVDAAVTRAQLDAGSLTYTPPTDKTGTGVPFFLFAVSDGIAESTSVYRIDIDIAADTVAPGRPRNLTAVPGNGAVALRWEAPSSPGSSAIVRYEVRHAAGDAVPPATAWESVGLTFTHTVTGLADGPHTFEVRAVNSSTPSEGTAAQVRDTPSATLTPTVSMEEVEVRVAEDAGTAVVTVLLDRPSTAALTVPWETADDTAVSPDDYIGGEGSVIFAPGETRNTLSVRIVDDPLLEDPVDGRHERFWVLPSRGDGYRLENGGEAVSVVIEDNDGDGPVTANTPATGAPTITGTAQVGQQLTAVTTGIMDADGLTSPTYTYQWIRVDTDSTEQDISGATSSTYTLVADDEGKTIKVKVSFTDDASHSETLTSAATAAVTVTANTPATGAPTITGTAQVGQTLTAVTTGIRDDDGLTSVSYTYQWIRVDTDSTEQDISGATSSTYTLVAADQGKTIKVKVSFTDDASHSETRTSAATATVGAAATAPPPPVTANTPATGAPTITGTAQVGQTLTAVTTGIRDADGLTSPTYTYQWIRVDTDSTEQDISGATSSTYTLVADDEGKTIKVKVSFTDDASHSETRTSAATATVGAAATAPPPVTDLEQVMGVGVAPGNAQLVVTWTAVDNAGGYTVQWKSGGQGYNTGTRLATVTSGSTTRYTIPSLTNGTAYTVRVTATRTGATDGPPSAEMTGTPTGEPEPVPALPLAGAIGLGLLLLGTGGRALRGRARG